MTIGKTLTGATHTHAADYRPSRTTLAVVTPNTPRDAAATIARKLASAGHLAYFAGGCVRDELLGFQPTDYDIATDASPDRIRSLFNRTALVGAAFGVVLVRELGHTIEVATFRADGPYSDRRHPDHVTFSDPRTDALRRDFTINALFLEPSSQPNNTRQHVIDFVGGLADLDQGIIRAVGNPDQRLAEDHLRALRAVRFAARFDFTIDPATLDALRRNASHLVGVSRERIGEEIRRILTHHARVRAIALLAETGLESPVLQEPTSPAPLDHLLLLDQNASYPLILAAWALDRHGHNLAPETIARQWRLALVLSNEDRDAFVQHLELAAHLRSAWATATTAQRKRWAMHPCFYGSLALVATSPDLQAAILSDLDRLRATPTGLAPAPFIDGNSLIQAGFTPGPGFRLVLDQVYDLQLESTITHFEQALAKARELAAQFGVQQSRPN